MDGVLQLIVQIPPDNVSLNEKRESITSIPAELRGRYGRIVVRLGSYVLPREPSIEKLVLRPMVLTNGEQLRTNADEQLLVKSHLVTGDHEIADQVVSKLLAGKPNVRMAKDETVKSLILRAQAAEHQLVQNTLATLAGKEGQDSIGPETQIVISIAADKLKAMKQKSLKFPNGQEYVHNVAGPIQAAKIVVRFVD